MKRIPVDLADVSLADSTNAKSSYFGYDFQLPWSDVDEQNSKANAKVAILPFRSGLYVVIKDIAPKSLINSLLADGKLDPSEFSQLYGEKSLDSDYAFTRIMLDATPSQLNLRTPHKDGVRASMLLMMKAIAVPVDSGIFNVHSGDFKGFQYGDPTEHPNRIVVDLFSDNKSLELTFSRKDKAALSVSQPEINRIVMTLQQSSAGSQAPSVRSNSKAQRTQPGT
ncbi:MAG: hypothetical protein ACJ71N_13515 [Terriglobales bacterium]